MGLFKTAAFGLLAGAASLIGGTPKVATRVWANNTDLPFDIVLAPRQDRSEVNNLEFTDITGKSADQAEAARLAGKPRMLGQDSRTVEDRRITLGPHTRWLVAFPQSGKLVKTFYHAFSVQDHLGYDVEHFTCDEGPLTPSGAFKLELLGKHKWVNYRPTATYTINKPQGGCLTIDTAR